LKSEDKGPSTDFFPSLIGLHADGSNQRLPDLFGFITWAAQNILLQREKKWLLKQYRSNVNEGSSKIEQ